MHGIYNKGKSIFRTGESKEKSSSILKNEAGVPLKRESPVQEKKAAIKKAITEQMNAFVKPQNASEKMIAFLKDAKEIFGNDKAFNTVITETLSKYAQVNEQVSTTQNKMATNVLSTFGLTFPGSEPLWTPIEYGRTEGAGPASQHSAPSAPPAYQLLPSSQHKVTDGLTPQESPVPMIKDSDSIGETDKYLQIAEAEIIPITVEALPIEHTPLTQDKLQELSSRIDAEGITIPKRRGQSTTKLLVEAVKNSPSSEKQEFMVKLVKYVGTKIQEAAENKKPGNASEKFIQDTTAKCFDLLRDTEFSLNAPETNDFNLILSTVLGDTLSKAKNGIEGRIIFNLLEHFRPENIARTWPSGDTPASEPQLCVLPHMLGGTSEQINTYAFIGQWQDGKCEGTRIDQYGNKVVGTFTEDGKVYSGTGSFDVGGHSMSAKWEDGKWTSTHSQMFVHNDIAVVVVNPLVVNPLKKDIHYRVDNQGNVFKGSYKTTYTDGRETIVPISGHGTFIDRSGAKVTGTWEKGICIQGTWKAPQGTFLGDEGVNFTGSFDDNGKPLTGVGTIYQGHKKVTGEWKDGDCVSGTWEEMTTTSQRDPHRPGQTIVIKESFTGSFDNKGNPLTGTGTLILNNKIITGEWENGICIQGTDTTGEPLTGTLSSP